MKKLTMNEIYCLFCRHGHLVNGLIDVSGRLEGPQTGEKAEDGKTLDEEKKTPEKGAEEE